MTVLEITNFSSLKRFQVILVQREKTQKMKQDDYEKNGEAQVTCNWGFLLFRNFTRTDLLHFVCSFITESLVISLQYSFATANIWTTVLALLTLLRIIALIKKCKNCIYFLYQ